MLMIKVYSFSQHNLRAAQTKLVPGDGPVQTIKNIYLAKRIYEK